MNYITTTTTDSTNINITPSITIPPFTYFYNGHDLNKWNKIQKVIYNNPATIVLWEDGTKTVVKCQDGETYDPELGLLYCIAKQFMKSSFHKQMRDHCWEREDIVEYYNREHDLSEFNRLLP